MMNAMDVARRLSAAISARLNYLGWGVADWQRASGVSDRTLRAMRDGTRTSWVIRVERPAERALGWAPGSYDRIREGGDPELIATASTAPLPGDIRALADLAERLAAGLRAISEERERALEALHAEEDRR